MTTPPPFEFVTRRPEPPLDRFVASLWYARGTISYSRERIAPTGSTVAVIVLGDPIRQTTDDGAGPTYTATDGFVAGPHDRPIINEPTGETHAVGVVTTPIGCEALFGRRPATIRGQVVAITRFWPQAVRLRTQLRALAAQPALDLVDQALRAGLGPGPDGLDRCEAAITIVETDPTRPIADIAAQLGTSHNQLGREFTRIVGLSPRSLARLLRVRRLLTSLDIHGDTDWATRSAELGWYDQAHLIRDFKRHTGVTPTQYLAAQRTFLGAEEAAGFVPEP